MARYLIGIDNGGTMSKAAVFSSDGRELAAAGRNVEIISKHSGWSERDMEAMWRGTVEAIREAVAVAGISAEDIAGIACTGHGNGLYLIDAEGRPVRNAINSMDSRASAIAEAWNAKGLDAQLLPKITQKIWAAQPAVLLTWLREHEPESIRKSAAVLMAKDYIRFRLTGKIAMEITDMSGAGIMNVITGQYDDSVLEAFGIPEMRRLLPPLVQSADVCGTITSEVAGLTGLKVGTPVAGGMFDIDACSLASGSLTEGQFVMVAGTWANNQYVSPKPLVDKDIFITSRYCVPGNFLMFEGSPTGAGNLEWFAEEFLCEKKIQLGGPLLKWADEEVAKIEPTEDAPLFLPFLYGSNVGAGYKACFLGIEKRHTRADLMRAVYEGCAFSHQYHLKRLCQFTPVPEVVRLTGGAAKSRVWMQIFADVFQIPVEIPEGSELGALGAAIAAAVASGVHDSYEGAVKAMVRTARRQEPDGSRAAVYAARYGKYLAAVGALKSFFIK